MLSAGLILGLALLCGCFQTKDELTLEADGSGKVRIETRTSIPPEMLAGLEARMGADGAGAIYPPLTEAVAIKFFPSRDFTLSVKEEKAGDSGRVILVEATFKDVNALLASPYGRAHALSLKIEGGRLELKAHAGMEAAARLAEMKDEGGMFAGELPALPELQKKKGELRSEFRVTLPGVIASANGRSDNRSVTWVAERAKFTNALEFAQKLGVVLEASCAAEGLKMSPVTPMRMALRPFKELQAGASAGPGGAPDAGKVAMAAKFVPYALQVTRSLDLSGEGAARANLAQLIGAMVLPREFAPTKWGEVKLEEVSDAKGNSLMMDGNRGASFLETRHGGTGDEGGQDVKAPGAGAEERKTVTLRFQPPEWKVKEIARIKGSMSLQYPGGAQHVVKLTNAVPARWIKEVSKEEDMEFGDTPRPLNDSALPELGLSLDFHMGMAQSACTMLMLQGSGRKAVLSEAQVFDADGRPWPTFLQQQAYDDQDTFTLTIAGRPAPPLSIALLATGVGGIVEVPILLEKIPMRQP